MTNPYRWLGWKREREVFKLYTQHANKVKEIIDELEKFIAAFYEGNKEKYQESFNKIFDQEREADNLKEKIIYELSKGPFHPIDREDIIRLMMETDDIASYAKGGARKLTHLTANDIPTNIKEGLVTMVKMIKEEMNYLMNALESLIKNPKESLKYANNVERKEEEIDEFKEELITSILLWGDQTGSISRWLMVKEAVEYFENMADKIEDVGDIIRGLAIST